MNIVLKLFFSGVLIFLTALLFNMFATHFGISTWYDLIKEAGEWGITNTIKTQKAASLIFLFLVYPFALGAAGYLGRIFFNKS